MARPWAFLGRSWTSGIPRARWFQGLWPHILVLDAPSYVHPLVIFSAFFGSFAGDQIIFFIGRLKGKEFLGKRPSWNARVEKIRHLLERYQTPIILGFRFVYGFRTITPLAIGMSHVKTGAFILLSWVCDIVVGRIDKTGKMPYSLIAH